MPPMRSRLTLLIAALALLAAPGAASAAIVTNGDFETGNLSGWQSDNTFVNSWFTYTAADAGPFPVPPQGNFAAVTDQGAPGRAFLYQDITLPSGGTVAQLSLFAYYDSGAPIASPDTLDPAVDPNQQYRIDVLRPSAPTGSVAPGDVLATVFRTFTGDPQSVGPTLRTADLSAFAGQTVRIRLAVTVTEDPLNGAADAIAVKSNAFTIGQAVRNKKKGTAQLPVTVPDAGTLVLSGTGLKGFAASKSVAAGGTVNLLIKAKGKAKRKLNDSGKAKVKPKITYTPTGVASNTQQTKVKLKKKV
jgi:hypothetical protein